MNSYQRPYLFGLIFMAFGLYQLYQKQYIEFTLYGLAGLSFIFNQLASEPKLVEHKKTLAIVTWVFIIATGLTFSIYYDSNIFRTIYFYNKSQPCKILSAAMSIF